MMQQSPWVLVRLSQMVGGMERRSVGHVGRDDGVAATFRQKRLLSVFFVGENWCFSMHRLLINRFPSYLETVSRNCVLLAG